MNDSMMLELIPTEELIKTLLSRFDSGVIALAKRVATGEDLSRREYCGSLSSGVGLCSEMAHYLNRKLDETRRNPDPHEVS